MITAQSKFKEVSFMKFYEDLEQALQNLTSRGAFLTVKGSDGTVNTMTISWGYIGYSWNKPYFVALVRPSRYTHELIETADSYTISIPYDDEMGKALSICGSKSGRDVNKEELANIKFIPSQEVSAPIVDHCNMYYECKITYTDQIQVDQLPDELRKKNYNGDYHDMYYGEIVKTYKK